MNSTCHWCLAWYLSRNWGWWSTIDSVLFSYTAPNVTVSHIINEAWCRNKTVHGPEIIQDLFTTFVFTFLHFFHPFYLKIFQHHFIQITSNNKKLRHRHSAPVALGPRGNGLGDHARLRPYHLETWENFGERQRWILLSIILSVFYITYLHTHVLYLLYISALHQCIVAPSWTH